MLGAVRQMDGRKIDQHRIIVDRELGRTKATWIPRRLGGGKGEARRDRRDEQLIRELKKGLPAEEQPSQSGEESKDPAAILPETTVLKQEVEVTDDIPDAVTTLEKKED